MYFANLGGLIALVVMIVTMLLLVPGERIGRLFPLGTVFGLILGMVTYYLLQNVLQAWHFQHMDLINLAGIPLLMTLAWVPYSIIYFHLLSQYRTPAHNVLLILFAAAAPTVFQFLLEVNGMVVLNKWAWWGNFLYALIVFNGLGHLVYQRLLRTAKRTIG